MTLDEEGLTPLQVAMCSGAENCAEYLLEQNKNV